MAFPSQNDKAMALYQGPSSSVGQSDATLMQHLDIEDGRGRASEPDNSCRSWIFPMRPFRWCPNALCIWFPDTLKEIQDWTHFSLAMGMVAMLVMICQIIVTIAMVQIRIFTPAYLFGIREVLAVLLFCTVSSYCWMIIQQYDQRLVDKQAEARRAKEELSKKYQDLCSEMHDTLDKFAEYTGAYAQNIFEGKYRSFAHWAKQVAQALETDSRDLMPEEKNELLEEFRKMCMNWFRVLSECGINPAEKPIILCKKEELDKLTSFTDIAKCVQERCQPPKITMESRRAPKSEQWTSHMKGRCTKCETIYSVQQASDNHGKCKSCTKGVVGLTYWLEEVPAWSSKRPGSCPRCKEWFSPEMANECDAICPKCPGVELTELKPVTQELQQQQQTLKKDASHAKQQAKRFSGGEGTIPGFSSSSRILIPPQAPATKRCPCWPSWFRCEGGCHCSKVVSASEDGYPTKYMCCCMSLKVFSRDHVRLMLGFLICLAMVAANVVLISHGLSNDSDKTASYSADFILRISENIVVQVSLLVLLLRFEDLDLVQQLEKETCEMREEKDRVENTNKEVQTTFGMLQKMNVVWLNRTIPRLDLMNEISNKLCDVDQKTSKSEWSDANLAIQNLEKKIGCISDWIDDKKLTDQDKKSFEKMIKHVYQDDHIIESLKRVNNEKLGFLKALEPPKPDKPMASVEELRAAGASPIVTELDDHIVLNRRASEVPQADV